MFKKISGNNTISNDITDINEILKEQAEENEERLFADSEGLYERIQSDLDYMLAEEIGESEYGELDSMIQILLGNEYESYEKVKKEFFADKKKTIENELELNNVENMTFTEFTYFYLQKTTNSYFYENLSTGYAEGFKNLLATEGISLENINWESLSEKEERYEELLIDITFSLINKELKAEKKTLFGIDIGLGSKLFFVRETSDYKKIKEIETDFYYIYDLEYLKNFYTSLYQIIVEPYKELGIYKGDFVELVSGESGIVKIKTLFKKDNNEHDINKNILKQVF